MNGFGLIAAGREREPQADDHQERCDHGKRESDCDSHLSLLRVNVMRDTRGENGMFPQLSAQASLRNTGPTDGNARQRRTTLYVDSPA